MLLSPAGFSAVSKVKPAHALIVLHDGKKVCPFFAGPLCEAHLPPDVMKSVAGENLIVQGTGIRASCFLRMDLSVCCFGAIAIQRSPNPNCSDAMAQMAEPMASDAVAAGEGAFNTCSALPWRSMRKSSIMSPAGSSAIARTPARPGTRSSICKEGINLRSLFRNSRFENARRYSSRPKRQCL